jgi:hypothetical protein
MDLLQELLYHFSVTGKLSEPFDFRKGLPTMKLAIQIFALCVVVAGAAAASVSPKTTQLLASHQSATSALPVPCCGPGMPCPASGK